MPVPGDSKPPASPEKVSVTVHRLEEIALPAEPREAETPRQSATNVCRRAGCIATPAASSMESGSASHVGAMSSRSAATGLERAVRVPVVLGEELQGTAASSRPGPSRRAGSSRSVVGRKPVRIAPPEWEGDADLAEQLGGGEPEQVGAARDAEARRLPEGVLGSPRRRPRPSPRAPPRRARGGRGGRRRRDRCGRRRRR